jgi:UDP-N-acetylglucosamine 2-epimerase (non-hydrolysing)
MLPKPKYYLDAASDSPIETIGSILMRIEPILKQESPDAFLVLGDTNSCLSAIAAKRSKIPVFHLEAGNRCFDERVPEEINRKIIDHLADVNLTYSELSKDYLMREGMNPDFVIKVGSPMREVLFANENKWKSTGILQKLGLLPEKFILASFHREENVDSVESLADIVSSIKELQVNLKVPVVISAHPRTVKQLEKMNIDFDENFMISKPFSFNDYIHLQSNALIVLSDSGTITEESSILGFTAVNIRTAQERPEGMEESVVILSGRGKENILSAVNLALSHKKSKIKINQVQDYSDSNVSVKVSRIIQSYVPYVNEYVWHK